MIFSSKESNGTASSVNGNGIANKIFESYTDLKYETNSTGMANIGYKINDNNKISYNFISIPRLNQKKTSVTL
jgi:hypothetical protein